MKDDPKDAKPETVKDANTRDSMQKIGRLIAQELPTGWGFFCLCYPFRDTQGRANYIANGKREDIIRAMKEFITRNEDNSEMFGKHV